MDINERMGLIGEVGEEVVTLPELEHLLEEKQHPVAYDGFEPSGHPHIAQGVMRAININKMIKAGFRFKILVADWHAWANNKMGGDLDHIRLVGRYLMETWKASGMDLSSVEFINASDLVRDEEYWGTVMKVSINSTVKRVLRCSQIMGRKQSDSLQASQIIYPCMQVADIFHLGADVCQLGMDQRKVNMLAREIGPKLGYQKPLVVSHHMLMGLGQPPGEGTNAVERAMAMKMSKSVPDSAILMTDSTKDVQRKIRKAYCPEGVVVENPILEYCRYIVFERFPSLEIERPEKWGGDLSITSYHELEELFGNRELHPGDLKTAVAGRINEALQPVRDHFEKDPGAARLKEEVDELLEKLKKGPGSR